MPAKQRTGVTAPRRNRARWAATAVLAAVMFAAGIGVGGALTDDDGDDLSALNEEVVGLQAEVERLEERNRQLEDLVAEEEGREEMPDLVGRSVDDVEDLVISRGWELAVEERPSDTSPGTVLDQAPPPGTPMVAGSLVRVVVAG